MFDKVKLTKLHKCLRASDMDKQKLNIKNCLVVFVIFDNLQWSEILTKQNWSTAKSNFDAQNIGFIHPPNTDRNQKHLV